MPVNGSAASNVRFSFVAIGVSLAHSVLQRIGPLTPLSQPQSASAPNRDACAFEAQDRWFADEVQPHEPALRAFLRRRFPTVCDWDDVVQETYLKTLKARNKGSLTSVRGFLFAVAGNVTISLFRKRKYISDLAVSELPTSAVLEDDVNVIETVCGQEEIGLVADAIAGLPGRCREVAVLRLIKGEECHAIATQLGISENTVRVQLARAMKKCAQYFEERGIPREGRP